MKKHKVFLPPSKIPLIVAAEKGWAEGVDILLKHGASVNQTTTKGWSALHYTMMKGSVQDVEKRTKCADMLIKAGADVNRKDVLGCTVLMAAVENGCVGITDLLLKNGADVNITNPGGASALHYTTKQGSLQDVEARTKCADMLIRAGADVNSKDVLGVPVLMVAVENGCEKITDLLLENGADVNITNPAGASALHYTTKQGSLQDVEARTECADMLIRAGADVNSKDVLGFTALMVAVENGIKGLSKKLISVGADVNVSFSDGQTVLMKAIEKKQYDAAKFMIMEGAEIKAKQLEGNTKASNKLKEALKKKKEYDFTLHLNSRDAMRKHLMSLIPNSNLFTVVQKLGLNPWLKKYIVFGGHYECALDYTVRRCSTQGVEFQTKCADLLIKAGVDVNSANKEGTTALMTAVKNEFEQIAKLLIHAGANVNVSYSNGQTVLMKAIETKQWDVVKSLITEGVEIAPKLLEGNSALSIALNKALKKRKRNALYSNNRDVLRKELMSLIPTSNLMAMVQKLILEPQLKNYIIYGGHHKCLGVLLKSMLNVNESDDKGYTPLMHAAGKGHKECVQFLIKVGADLNTANLLGETAVMRAARKGYVGCVDLLIKSGAQVNALPLHKIPMCGSLFVVNLI